MKLVLSEENKHRIETVDGFDAAYFIGAKSLWIGVYTTPYKLAGRMEDAIRHWRLNG